MRVLIWLVRAFLFFALFAFALNNRHEVTVHWFFSATWSAPLVIVVLAAFGAGCVLGVLAMVPGWWRGRRDETEREPSPSAIATVVPAATSSDYVPLHPPREGL